LKPDFRRTVDQARAVSPGLTAGGGLKLDPERHGPYAQQVSPGLTAGGGLKLPYVELADGCALFPPASPPGAD